MHIIGFYLYEVQNRHKWSMVIKVMTNGSYLLVVFTKGGHSGAFAMIWAVVTWVYIFLKKIHWTI